MTTFVGTGAALSATAVAAKEDLVARQVPDPVRVRGEGDRERTAAVFTLPSFKVSVATGLDTATLASVFPAPPGAFASVQTVAGAEYAINASLNVAWTRSTRPSASTSNIWSVESAGAVLSIVTLPLWLVLVPRLSAASTV